jgi:hypothetical protein
VEEVLGVMAPVPRLDVDARLSDVDRLLRGVGRLLDVGLRYDTDGPKGVWRGLAVSLDARRSINNEDGTVSQGSLGAEVCIERAPGDSDRWLVWARAGQNCNRRRCPDDPHMLFDEEGETGTAADAVDVAVVFTSHLVDKLRSMSRSQLDYFVHK